MEEGFDPLYPSSKRVLGSEITGVSESNPRTKLLDLGLRSIRLSRDALIRPPLTVATRSSIIALGISL